MMIGAIICNILMLCDLESTGPVRNHQARITHPSSVYVLVKEAP